MLTSLKQVIDVPWNDLIIPSFRTPKWLFPALHSHLWQLLISSWWTYPLLSWQSYGRSSTVSHHHVKLPIPLCTEQPHRFPFTFSFMRMLLTRAKAPQNILWKVHLESCNLPSCLSVSCSYTPVTTQDVLLFCKSNSIISYILRNDWIDTFLVNLTKFLLSTGFAHPHGTTRVTFMWRKKETSHDYPLPLWSTTPFL